MRPIDQIVQHYKDTCDQSVEVPEWGGLNIHWKTLTIADFKRMQARPMDNADVLVDMARDKDGNKLFDAEDKLKLRDCADATIVGRITKLMLRVDTVEEATKN